eukprot:TRINITY_DN46_c0_g1_i2.p1 TRINITY_DN46_c0_g1~~TRINITY_DN46_c0_g1_i2.p1  ORF type:complete len:373 (-),score=59.23 TRINITY_DN46_c0_g1_i2:676-1794(-)
MDKTVIATKDTEKDKQPTQEEVKQPSDQTNQPAENTKKEEVKQPNTQQQENKQAQQPINYFKPQYIYVNNTNNLDDVIKKLPHLESLKQYAQTDFNKIQDAYCVIIRSNNDDDVHKAIKYNVWCSTGTTNQMLNQLYQKAKSENKDIYLFFSVVKSGQFSGVAKLIDQLDETQSFAYWWQIHKWRGIFKLQWVFIKDIIYKKFEGLNNELHLPVIRSKDGTKLIWEETGKKMLDIFQKADKEPNIFNDFEIMEEREQGLRSMRDQQISQNKPLSHGSNIMAQQFHHQTQQQQFVNPHFMPNPHYNKNQYHYNNRQVPKYGGQYYIPNQFQGQYQGNQYNYFYHYPQQQFIPPVVQHYPQNLYQQKQVQSQKK